MSLEIYPADFHTRYQIGNAISVLLSGYYDKVGKVIITTDITDYNIKVLRQGCIAYDTVLDLVFVLQYIKQDTKESRITAYGFSGEWVLNQRAIKVDHTINNVEADSYNIIDNNLRGLTSIRTASIKGLPETADGAIIEPGQLLDKITSVLNEHSLGCRAVWDDKTKQMVFEIYKGVDRTHGIHAVVFSDEQGTAQGLVINDDMSTLKNVAYIVVEFNDDTKDVFSVGRASGNDRREIFVKRRIIQGYEEIREDAIKRAKSEAAAELARNIRRQNFSVSIDPQDLGTRYNIGDLVSCVSIRFQVKFTARVSGVKYTMDRRGTKTEVILGEPQVTEIGGISVD